MWLSPLTALYTYQCRWKTAAAKIRLTASGQEQEIVGAAWDISTSALYSVDADASGINAEDALDMVLAMQKVMVEFTYSSGDKNRTASGTKYSGYVWLNDHSITATNRQNGTYSLQAQGTGPLSKGVGPVQQQDSDQLH